MKLWQPEARVGRGLGALIAAVWAALSWPAVRDEWGAPGLRWSLAAALVVALVAASVEPLGRAAAWLAGGGPRWPARLVAGVAATALPGWLFWGPMRGQVMARDACHYVLEGRALGHGQFGVPETAPGLAQSVHFLFEGADGRLHGVFAAGYPLFLAPFVALGRAWLAGPVTGLGLVFAVSRFARRVSPDPAVERLALAFAAASFAWAIETADLLSHAFVGALATLSLVAALDLAEGRREGPWAGLGLGLSAGWCFAARMLDGMLVGLAVMPLLFAPMLRRSAVRKTLLIAAVAAMPLVGLVALQQRAATGSFRVPTSVAYARRADWPPTCLRLGFGVDVGCAVEHGPERASFGADGYTPDDALRVVGARTGRLGVDLFALSTLAALALAGVMARPRRATALGASWALLLSLGYGLFYYGNAVVYGARHLFPAGPVLVVLLADGVWGLGGWLGRGRDPATERARRGAAVLGVAVLMALPTAARWREGLALTRAIQAPRSDVRAIVAAQHLRDAVVIVRDIASFTEALDPWRDAPAGRVLVLDDRAGNLDARRFARGARVWHVGAFGQVSRAASAAPGPGFDVELERAWPAFQRVEGLGASIVFTPGCCRIASSGEHVLFVFEASPGASLTVPFDIADGGVWSLRVEALRAPDYGQWEGRVDGQTLGRFDGYAPRVTAAVWEAPGRFSLARGRHTLRLVSVGRAAASTGYRGGFDVLRGAPAP